MWVLLLLLLQLLEGIANAVVLAHWDFTFSSHYFCVVPSELVVLFTNITMTVGLSIDCDIDSVIDSSILVAKLSKVGTFI